MSIQPTPKTYYHIKAEFIGPIMRLDSQLSFKDQNLIFATNGTGKSFLARAFRTLDDNAYENTDKESIAESIVSEEANPKGGIGSFSFSKGGTVNGKLSLNTKSKTTTRTDINFLYHVFSTDYIETELKSQQYELDGNIEHEIIIGKENAELNAKIEEINAKKAHLKTFWRDWNKKFEVAKDTLKTNFSINAQLGAFKSILLDYWTGDNFSPDPEASVAKIQLEYDQYKTFPTDHKTPNIGQCDPIIFDLTELSESLGSVVSVSTVSDQVKESIRQNQNFYLHGLAQYDHNKETCPFCTQEITEVALSAISTYQQYFADEEAKLIKKLKVQERILKQKIEAVEDYKTNLLQAIIEYDDLKKYFSGLKGTELFNSTPQLDALRVAYEGLLSEIESKTQSISTEMQVTVADQITALHKEIQNHNEENTKLSSSLNTAIENLDSERKGIQRRACEAFKSQFYNDNQSLSESISELENKISELSLQAAELQKTFGQKVDARSKVAETFAMLLSFVFGGKYSFDEKEFTVKRNKQDMTRGGDRTLSDGEKSVLAFCYFIAQTHLRVETIDCYKKLFFVVDDPVSSLSYDYIYSIAQILKCLQIAGSEISIQQIPNPRPKLLILTHNDYLYNIASINKIVQPDSIFQLVSSDPTKHEFIKLKTFLTPHIQHLDHVRKVSDGIVQPSHYTANSIRSVIESIWRFCRPDCGDLAAFINVANTEANITTKSLLIYDLSHGAKYVSSPPTPTDLKTAAIEAIAIVNYYASGQVSAVSG